MRFFLLMAVSVILLFTGCEKPNDSDSGGYKIPSTIKGQITNPEGVGVAGAKITLTTAAGFEAVYSTTNGLYTISGFPAAKHTARIEKPGYSERIIEIPSAVNGASTLNVQLSRATYVIPEVKPLSSGPVRINYGKLETDFAGTGTYTPFYVKGVAFSPKPIDDKPITTKLYDQCITYLKELNANTIRTYSGVDKYMLKKCAENGIRVIVTYWVNTDLDFANTTVRKNLIDGFAAMVLDLKDFPGVLMWNLGNEQNVKNGANVNWFTLTQEMAIEAYKVEGAKYHPVCINNGGIMNVGLKGIKSNDSSLTYVDAWATNIYAVDLTNDFIAYKSKSNKPLVITEFGIDALDNRTKVEYETTQASHDSSNWAQIKSAPFILGGTVFEFTDEWWKEGLAGTQDYGGYATTAHPDGYSNEEWYGLIRLSRDTNGDGVDEWYKRKAFYMFSRNWK